MKKQELYGIILKLQDICDSIEQFSDDIQSFPDLLTVSQSARLKRFLDKSEETISDYISCYIGFQVEQSEHYVDEFLALQTGRSFRTTINDLVEIAMQKLDVIKDDSNPQSGSVHRVSEKVVLPQTRSLPTLPIPTFHGKISEYVSFKSNFQSVVDDASVDNIQRLLYLKSSLKGDASQALSGVAIASDNYKIAWELLDARFYKPKLIVHSHISNIFNLKPVQKGSYQSLQVFVDELNINLTCLEQLGTSNENLANALLYHLIETKLDNDSQERLRKLNLTETPSISTVTQFLQDRVSGLFSTNLDVSSKSPKFVKTYRNHSLVTTTQRSFKCFGCNDNHTLSKCPKLIALSVNDRIQRVRELKVCNRCLGHTAALPCRSKFSCSHCNKSHHTLLHISKESQASEPTSKEDVSDLNYKAGISSLFNPTTSSTCTTFISKSVVLLGTVQISILNSSGVPVVARGLLDNGSMHSLVSRNLMKKLALPTKPINVSLVGVSGQATTISELAKLCISSCATRFRTNINCLVVNKIASLIPAVSFDSSYFQIPANIVLADPNFNTSSEIDILIGAEQFYDLLCIGQFSLGSKMPTLQKTKLGYIVTGTVYPASTRNNNSSCLLATSHVDFDLQRFWELDRVPEPAENSLLSKDDQFCMRYFQDNVYRSNDNKLVVSIPFNQFISQLGESYDIALNRFLALERRLDKCPERKQTYSEFIREYSDLNHLSAITESEMSKFNFLPHHEVLKHDSSTTKLRVVFDGSAKTSTGLSLNDCQYAGPVLQNELFSILLNFRKYPVALTADCTKMYRQIWINPSQRKYQCILWRSNKSEEVKALQLSTVTYGLRSSSFLAIRSLSFIADECSNQNPDISAKIKTEFYVDDFISGANSNEEALQLRKDVTAILGAYGIPLGKFCSNQLSVLDSNTYQSDAVDFHDAQSKTLGISWRPYRDEFQFSWSFEVNLVRITKREILSSLSRLFDPLGFIAPIIVVGKLLIQELWKDQVSWDETVSLALQSKWEIFASSIACAPMLHVPRYILFKDALSVEVHCFSDASCVAYGCCIYIKSIFMDHVKVHLLCSKSRVAPLKTISLPRLELSAAVLSAELGSKVLNILSSFKFNKWVNWTDSKIVLGWLNSAPNLFQTFVANRVARIQDLTNVSDWRHCRSEDNPADIVSRGCNFHQLEENDVWFKGPLFLRTADLAVAEEHFSNCSDLPEHKITKTNLVTVDDDNFIDLLIRKFSFLIRIQRVLSYIRRFCYNCRSSKAKRLDGCLNATELTDSLKALSLRVQKLSFPDARLAILRGETRKIKDVSLNSLNLFLDEQQLLRVGGRIRHSNLNYDKLHPILLPKKHILSKLIVLHFHLKFLHCGIRHLVAVIRERFWIISAKQLCKEVIRECVQCFKVKPTGVQPIMGNLPSFRFAFFQRCFTHCGLDFAGPITIKDRYVRKPLFIKAYISVFVCLTTKAIHLELLTSLSSAAFLEVLKRFIARRGCPTNIYSDNATNFTATADELHELYDNFSKSIIQNDMFNYLSNRGVCWHFIPPSSPHFGGMWEAGVRSTKFHLTRVLRDRKLNFEDLSTVLAQIEGILNSRPICPVSTDPNDFCALTPFHFLIGGSSEPLPAEDVSQLPENRLDQFQLRQKIILHFWQRFKREVLPEYQARTKWVKNIGDIGLIQIGQLVLVNEPNSPPFQWPLARISEVHPGADGQVRVVTLRLPSGSYCKRPTIKIFPLPVLC